MAPSPSPDAPLAEREGDLLLRIAEEAVVDGLLGSPPRGRAVSTMPPALREPRGVFVTLSVNGRLNGCLGSMEGVEPLAHGTARHAWSAAFADPRLPALRAADYEALTIEVSVLSRLAPLPARSRPELLAQLRPDLDGVVVAAANRRALFLPAVWDQLPDPADFLDHLQAKAGFPPPRWPEGMRAWRFSAQRFTRRATEHPTLSGRV